MVKAKLQQEVGTPSQVLRGLLDSYTCLRKVEVGFLLVWHMMVLSLIRTLSEKLAVWCGPVDEIHYAVWSKIEPRIA